MLDDPATQLLRPLQPSDLAVVRAWRNHRDVRRFMYTQHEITAAEHDAWFKLASQNPDKHLLLFERDGRPTGFINFTVVDWRAQRADWGFYLAPDAAPGSGGMLGRQALAHAFDTLDLHKLCGEALADNVKSLRFHERMGFQKEACLRDHHFDGQRYHDVVGFGLLRRDWSNHQGAMCP